MKICMDWAFKSYFSLKSFQHFTNEFTSSCHDEDKYTWALVSYISIYNFRCSNIYQLLRCLWCFDIYTSADPFFNMCPKICSMMRSNIWVKNYSKGGTKNLVTCLLLSIQLMPVGWCQLVDASWLMPVLLIAVCHISVFAYLWALHICCNLPYLTATIVTTLR